MVYKPAKIDFTPAQINKAIKGQPFRVKASQIGTGSKVIMLHPANHGAVVKAAMKGKGLTLTISPAEVLSTVESDMEGTGFFGDLWKGLKSGWKWVKNNIIDTPLYQSTVKPLVRQLVDTGATALAGVVPSAAPVIGVAKDVLGKETGAFGAPPVMRRNRMKRAIAVDDSAGSFRLN